jgi:hypothetical protein
MLMRLRRLTGKERLECPLKNDRPKLGRRTAPRAGRLPPAAGPGQTGERGAGQLRPAAGTTPQPAGIPPPPSPLLQSQPARPASLIGERELVPVADVLIARARGPAARARPRLIPRLDDVLP